MIKLHSWAIILKHSSSRIWNFLSVSIMNILQFEFDIWIHHSLFLTNVPFIVVVHFSVNYNLCRFYHFITFIRPELFFMNMHALPFRTGWTICFVFTFSQCSYYLYDFCVLLIFYNDLILLGAVFGNPFYGFIIGNFLSLFQRNSINSY